MQRVIVTVMRGDDNQERDLEVPAEVEVGLLGELIARALQWETGPSDRPVRYQIEAQPLGRTLDPSETLASAGVWDGSWLILQPVGQAAGPRSRPAAGPFGRWRPLEPGQPEQSPPGEPEQPSSEPKGSPGFVWKRLDDER